MTDVLHHRFTSPKANGSDATQVQPSHWNDGHSFTGGLPGDVLLRHPLDATYGATWGRLTQISYLNTPGPMTIAQVERPIHDARCGAPGVLTVQGAASPVSGAYGDLLIIRNVGSSVVWLESMTGGTGRPFKNLVTSGATPLGPGGSALYVYDASEWWALLQHEQGAAITVPYASDNYQPSWTVEAGDILEHTYAIHGRHLTFRIHIGNSTILSAVTQLNVYGWPAQMNHPGMYFAGITSNLATGWGPCLVGTNAPGGGVSFLKPDFSNWTPATNTAYFFAFGQMELL
jgi:hypothetical protein